MDSIIVKLQEIGSSPITSFISFFLAIIGIILAIFFYVKGRRFKELMYAIKHFDIITDYSHKIKDLEIHFMKQPVRDLTISHVAIWNNGTETIDKADLPSASNLQIQVDEKTKILWAELKFVTNIENGFAILNVYPDSDRKVFVSFDYLDPAEGAIVKIVHSGNEIKVTGAIKGGERPKLYQYLSGSPDDYWSHKNRLFDSHPSLEIMFITICVSCLLILYNILFSRNNSFFEWLTLPLFIAIALFLLREMIKWKIPKGFSIINKL